MTIIGLTGQTGAGKTTALSVFRDLGAEIIDCDEVYHELLGTSAEMLREIGTRFPEAVKDGVMDRKALGRLVFRDEERLRELNALTHRYVREEVRRTIDRLLDRGAECAVIDAIYLFESGLGEVCNATVYVTAPLEVRIQRIMARDGIARDYALLRADAQKQDAFYVTHCDYILQNSGTNAEFEAHCRALYLIILERSKKHE